MTTQILFIHGGGKGAHEADSKLADSLRNTLGTDYEVINPLMPNEDAPEYDAWKAQISKDIAAMRGKVILVGHSLGGSMLLKYLSETPIEMPLAGVFIISAPYWGAPDWEVDEYALYDGFAAHLPAQTPIFFYHGHSDDVVPFEHLAMYGARMPQATVRAFEGHDHQFNDDLSVVATDIKQL